MKHLLLLPLLLIPLGCAAIADLLSTPTEPPPATAPEEPGTGEPPPTAAPAPAPEGTVGGTLADIVGGLIGALTGNPVATVATTAAVSIGIGSFVKKYQSKKKEPAAPTKTEAK
jgi:hypothetical protein